MSTLPPLYVCSRFYFLDRPFDPLPPGTYRVRFDGQIRSQGTATPQPVGFSVMVNGAGFLRYSRNRFASGEADPTSVWTAFSTDDTITFDTVGVIQFVFDGDVNGEIQIT